MRYDAVRIKYRLKGKQRVNSLKKTHFNYFQTLSITFFYHSHPYATFTLLAIRLGFVVFRCCLCRQILGWHLRRHNKRFIHGSFSESDYPFILFNTKLSKIHPSFSCLILSLLDQGTVEFCCVDRF